MKASPLAVFLTIVIILIVGMVLCALFNPFSIPPRPPPQGSFSGVQKASSTTENVFFGPFNRDVKPQEIRIYIGNMSGAGWASYTMPLTGLSGPLDLFQSYNISGISGVTYTDLAQDERISNEDYITIAFVHSGSVSVQYQMAMVYIATGTVIDSITFYW